MFGLCMPTGSTYLVLKDGSKKNIASTDEMYPKKYIMQDEDILGWIKHLGYMNVESIMYEWNGKKTIVPMADYYAEHGQELEG